MSPWKRQVVDQYSTLLNIRCNACGVRFEIGDSVEVRDHPQPHPGGNLFLFFHERNRPVPCAPGEVNEAFRRIRDRYFQTGSLL